MSYRMPAGMANQRKLNAGTYYQAERSNYVRPRHYQVSFMEQQESDSCSIRPDGANANKESETTPQFGGMETRRPKGDISWH